MNSTEWTTADFEDWAVRRFWPRVEHKTGCLLWTGYRKKDGYGSCWFPPIKRVVGTHRIAWMLSCGKIPEGMQVLHSCDTPPCCNSMHLFLGTPADNMRDAAEKGRLSSQKKTHCPKGHPYTGTNLLIYAGRRNCRKCKNRRNDPVYQRNYRIKNRDKIRELRHRWESHRKAAQ